jgi:hypothetical protein
MDVHPTKNVSIGIDPYPIWDPKIIGSTQYKTIGKSFG